MITSPTHRDPPASYKDPCDYPAHLDNPGSSPPLKTLNHNSKIPFTGEVTNPPFPGDKGWTSLSGHYSAHDTYGTDTIIPPILQVRKLRYKESR